VGNCIANGKLCPGRAPHPNAALLFYEYMLGEAAQKWEKTFLDTMAGK